jgi:hypothetical protein
MELFVFTTCALILSYQYYYLLVLFLTSTFIFEWTIESDDKIFEDNFALLLKNSCLAINNYNKKFLNISIYNYLNTKFVVIISIIKKSISNKIEKIYINNIMSNVENNYDKLLMSCLGNIGNIGNIIESPSKYKDKKLNNVDDQIKKYISAFKKTS